MKPIDGDIIIDEIYKAVKEQSGRKIEIKHLFATMLKGASEMLDATEDQDAFQYAMGFITGYFIKLLIEGMAEDEVRAFFGRHPALDPTKFKEPSGKEDEKQSQAKNGKDNRA